MEKLKATRTAVNYDTVWECAIPYINDKRDRDAVSLVCKKWSEISSQTREHVTISFCYSAKPEQLSRRFSNLRSLKLKGKPRNAMFDSVPDDWGGYASPWVLEISRSLRCLNSIRFSRMIVTDSDLEMLASSHGRILEVFKLNKCSGFSTNGLRVICRSCRNLKTLLLEESSIVENDGEWVHELALNNEALETLNFYKTDLVQVRVEDLELIARKCVYLVSIKISECDIGNLIDFFSAAINLEEFGGSFSEPTEGAGGRYSAIALPPRLHSLGPTYLRADEIPVLFPIACHLKKLDLLYVSLNTAGHCNLLRSCLNLESLETRDVIGDSGLEVLSEWCTKLKRLKIEPGDDNWEMDDVEGVVTQRGLIALARGCLELEYIAVYVSDITNEALENIGEYLKKLCDFRLRLLDRGEITDPPLDKGVRSLLTGCHMLRRLALNLRYGELTDTGLKYIGEHSPNVRKLLLGYVGETDQALIDFARGCPSLQKLEMRDCCFSETALALAALLLRKLRFLWVQGYKASLTGRDLMIMSRRYRNIELIPARQVTVDEDEDDVYVVEHPGHILAYYSLAGQRTDFPDTVLPLDPNFFAD